MAERQYPEGTHVGIPVAAASILSVGALLWQGVKNILSAAFADGTLAAAGRQGLDELGEALKAFPESIQVQESGAIWNPTQGEIAAGRDPGKHLYGQSRPLGPLIHTSGFNRPPSTVHGDQSQPRGPSEIAAANRYRRRTGAGPRQGSRARASARDLTFRRLRRLSSGATP